MPDNWKRNENFYSSCCYRDFGCDRSCDRRSILLFYFASPKVTPSPTSTTPSQTATPTFITTPTPSTDHIAINEFELKPPENDDDLSVEEWVELILHLKKV
ncbi:MAG: hypothetical protein QXX08_08635, partial [Candidatus Bathyarchaeia archaeon]